MSIQTTITLTREEAVNKAVDIYIDKEKRRIKAIFYTMDDEELEDYIEEHFYNYQISYN